MTKKDYTLIARAITEADLFFVNEPTDSYLTMQRYKTVLLAELGKRLQADNPNFDQEKFKKAII